MSKGLAWSIGIGPAHDAVLEELLDRLATATGAPPARPAVMKPYARLTIAEAIKKYHPEITDEMLKNRDALIEKLNALKIGFRPQDGIYGLQLTLFENTVESQLFEPTFIYHYPAEVSPLARRDYANPDFTERFELYIAGREIANGFSELNDPEDQAARFRAQAANKDAGDEEAMYYDADFIRAL